MRTGFDNDKYLKIQSEHIKERISQFGDKLYLEFGGKLFDDYHASRVLPGFAPDSKLQMLMQLSDVAEIVIVISAADIEKNKVRGDLGITYDVDVVRLIGEFEKKGLYVGSVVITQFAGQNGAVQFREKLEKRGIKVYQHYKIEGYPANIPLIVSENGFGKNDYIETTRPLVVITAPGPGSGKVLSLHRLGHPLPRRGQSRGLFAERRSQETGLRPQAPCRGRAHRRDALPHAGQKRRALPGGVPPHPRPHPPDPRPAGRRWTPPAGRRQVWSGAGEQKVRPHRGPGSLFL